MGIWRQFVSCLTAAVVLVTSVNCLCQGALLPHDDADCHEAKEAAGKNSRCDHDEKGHHEQESTPCKHDDPTRHTCNHCQASLVSEPSSAKAVFHLFDLSLYGHAFDINALNLITLDLSHSHHFLSDLPPPVGPPTLLSLHCALTI